MQKKIPKMFQRIPKMFQSADEEGREGKERVVPNVESGNEIQEKTKRR